MKETIHNILTIIAIFGLVLFIATGVEAMMNNFRQDNYSGGHMMEEHHQDMQGSTYQHNYNRSKNFMTIDKAKNLAIEYLGRENNNKYELGESIDRKFFYEFEFTNVTHDTKHRLLIEKESGKIYQVR